jgi:hypothetical protein
MLRDCCAVEAKEQQQRALYEAVQQCDAAEARSVALAAELTSLKQRAATADQRHETELHACERTSGTYRCYTILFQ